MLGDAKMMCDMSVSVCAVTECKSGNIVELVCEELEYILNQLC
jgi:hypothetical protein